MKKVTIIDDITEQKTVELSYFQLKFFLLDLFEQEKSSETQFF